MNTLPIETIYGIYLNLNPSQILNIGEVLSTSIQNQHQKDIVNSEDFWDWYIKHKYYIHTYPKELNPQDIAFRSERLLKDLHEKQLYIPTYTLIYIFNYAPYDRIDEVLEVYTPQNLMSASAIVEHFVRFKTPMYNKFSSDLASDLMTVGLSDLIKLLDVDTQLPTLPDTPKLQRFDSRDVSYHHQFTRDEQIFYNKMIVLHTIPTSYFVPNGIITVEYNQDMVYIVSPEYIPDYMHRFWDYIQSNLSVVSRSVFMKYFAPLSF